MESISKLRATVLDREEENQLEALVAEKQKGRAIAGPAL
jgi:hypothetical protein